MELCGGQALSSLTVFAEVTPEPPTSPGLYSSGNVAHSLFSVSPRVNLGSRFICILSIFGNCLYLEGCSAWSIPPLWETERLFMETFIVHLLCTNTAGCKGIFLNLKRVIVIVIGDGLHDPEWLFIGTAWDFLKPCVLTQGNGCVKYRKTGGTSIKICWATWPPGNFSRSHLHVIWDSQIHQSHWYYRKL